MTLRTNSFSFFIFFILISLPLITNAAETIKTTDADQEGVEVTVYNNNLALIKDTRTITLPRGFGELRFMDVASHIMPVTVRARSLNYPDGFQVLEQNYEYDLMNANKLLDKYVGKDIKLINWNADKNRYKETHATLISNNQGQIYKIDDEIYLGHPGFRVLPEIPEELIAKPTLTWLYENTSILPHTLEVSYLTTNIGWKADYVVVLDRADKNGGISGWVSLDNRSGATYKDAQLKLIAGEVNLAPRAPVYKRKAIYEMADSAMQFTEKGFFEYHIYDLPRKTTIKDKQTKQIKLLETEDVKFNKEFLVKGQQHFFTGYYRLPDSKVPVEVFINFENSKKNKLGMPLPMGIMRLYKEDSEGSLQFIGEDRIEHTPKDELVQLKVGKAFDIVAKRVQTDYKLLSSNLYESTWKITLTNHKDEEVTVGIIEPLSNDWRVMEKSHAYEKVDAFTIRFDVDVPKDKEIIVTYKVRIKTP
jgi:hypothetical protein